LKLAAIFFFFYTFFSFFFFFFFYFLFFFFFFFFFFFYFFLFSFLILFLFFFFFQALNFPVETFGPLNALCLLLSILDANNPVFDLHLTDILCVVILPSVLGTFVIFWLEVCN